MARALSLLLLWIVQALLLILLLDAQWLEAQVHREQTLVRAELGPFDYAQLETRANGLYRSSFVDTHLVARSYDQLLPRSALDQHGMQNLAPWFFEGLRHRLDALWWLIYQAALRWELVYYWLGYVGALATAALIEGLAARAIKRVNHQPPSGDRYVLARTGLLIMGLSPLFYFSWPFPVSVSVIPIWGVLVAICTTLLAANAQHRV